MIEDLRSARRSAGYTQKSFASRLGVEPQTIRRLERGIGSMPVLIATMAALEFHLIGVGPGVSLAEQLRNRRRKLSLTLDELAKRTSMSRATISSLEKGRGTVASIVRLLAVIAPKARRRARERSYWGQGDKVDRDSRFTPDDFMLPIYEAFGEVDIDPCGHLLSPVLAHRRFTVSEDGDGLVDDWSGRLAYVNPPFSQLLVWLRRAYDQWQAGNVETVVCLVPVRTDSAWFHETLSDAADIYLLRGRVRFLDTLGKGQHTPFSLMVLTLGATPMQKARYAELVPGFWMSRSSTNAAG